MLEPITLYIADDHQMVVDGLSLLIGSDETIKIIGTANDGLTAYTKIVEQKPDLALVDLRMPEMSGLDVLFKLRKAAPQTKIIILSTHGEPRQIRDALKNGASGYLLKNADKAELMRCIHDVRQGAKYFPTLPSLKDPAEKPILTPREREVLKLVLEAYTTAEIAAQMNISTGTVDVHRKNINTKIGTKNPIAQQRFVDENLIDL